MVCIHLAWRDGFRHNASSHMKDLSSHVVFCNNMAAGGLPLLTVMGTMHEVGLLGGGHYGRHPLRAAEPVRHRQKTRCARA